MAKNRTPLLLKHKMRRPMLVKNHFQGSSNKCNSVQVILHKKSSTCVHVYPYAHTICHLNIYKYIYIYIYVCVCVRVMVHMMVHTAFLLGVGR